MGNRKDNEGQKTLLSPKRNNMGRDVDEGFPYEDEDPDYKTALDPGMLEKLRLFFIFRNHLTNNPLFLHRSTY